MLKLKRMADNASSLEMPIAIKTWEGSLDPVTQAEPEESANAGQVVIISLASICLKLM